MDAVFCTANHCKSRFIMQMKNTQPTKHIILDYGQSITLKNQLNF